MNTKTGKIQYQFKATNGNKEQNFIIAYNSFYTMIKAVYKAYKAHPDNIFIFGDPCNYKTAS